MNVEYVTINSVPSRVVTCGGTLNEAFANNQHKEMVFIIPGNPGLTGYYEDFVQDLYDKLHMPIWILCHAGHELQPNTPTPSYKECPDLFNLNGQIKHKVDFINQYIPVDVKIYLVGHSVGSYIILKILKDHLIRHQIRMSYLLFPAIERIGSSPNGSRFKFFNFFLSVILGLSMIFQLIPKIIGKYLVAGYFLLTGINRKNVRTTMHIIDPIVLRNIFSLAEEEMSTILELDETTVKENYPKLTFLYGRRDGWCPLKYLHEMVQRMPELKPMVNTTEVEHAFVLNYSREIAFNVSKWILDCK